MLIIHLLEGGFDVNQVPLFCTQSFRRKNCTTLSVEVMPLWLGSNIIGTVLHIVISSDIKRISNAYVLMANGQIQSLYYRRSKIRAFANRGWCVWDFHSLCNVFHNSIGQRSIQCEASSLFFRLSCAIACLQLE